MAAVTNLLHHILHRPPPPPPPLPPLSPSSSSSFLKPLRIFSTTSSKTPSKHLTSSNALTSLHLPNHSIPTKTKTLFTSRSLSLFIHRHSLSQPVKASLAMEIETELEDDEEEEDEEEVDELEAEDLDGEEEKEEKLDKEGLQSLRVRTNGMELPSLTVKEKKELASYAHSLGKKLKSQLVGKSGVNSNVATSFIETLEANELLKIKIHRTCPGELEDVVEQLEELTGSVVVGKIGRTVILYRPSLTKLKAEEKKREFKKIFERRKLGARRSFQAKVAGSRPRISNRGRRGSSRVSSPTVT